MSKFLSAIAALSQVYLLYPLTASATTATFEGGLSGSQDSLEAVASGANITSSGDLPTLIGKVISAVLGVLGILFVVLIVYAGILYLTSQGEDTNTKKAKKLLTQATMGLIIVVAAYAISNFVLAALTTISG